MGYTVHGVANMTEQPTFLVDQYGSAVVLKNNTPRYLIIDFAQADELQAAADDDVLAVSKKLMERNKAVYEELAK